MPWPVFGLRVPAHDAGVRVGRGDHAHLERVDAVPQLLSLLQAVLPDVADVRALVVTVGRDERALLPGDDARGGDQAVGVQDLEAAELVAGLRAGLEARVPPALTAALVLVDLHERLEPLVPAGVLL